MIAHVWDRVSQSEKVTAAVVATDDDRIAAYCNTAGIDVAMTSPDHATGTDRLAEVAGQRDADIYLNVQGDEPLIDPASIDACAVCLQDALPRGIEVATAYLRGATDAQMANPSVVHLVPTMDGCVLTFSRLPVPLDFRNESARTVHVGLYAFSGAALRRFATRARGPVERAESIELMRFLEYGERIACVPIPEGSVGVDHPEDIGKVEAMLRSNEG